MHNPERDARMARITRYGPRWSQSLADLAEHFQKSPEVRNAARCAKAVGVLRATIPELSTRIKPVRLTDGVLTLEVADRIALHECRTIHERTLLLRLVEAGCGIHRLAWRIKPGS